MPKGQPQITSSPIIGNIICLEYRDIVLKQMQHLNHRRNSVNEILKLEIFTDFY